MASIGTLILNFALLLSFAEIVKSKSIDNDFDGIDDTIEDNLANKFAPVIIHAEAEKYFPTNVDDYLSKSSLMFYDDECDFFFNGHENDYVTIVEAPKQKDLINKVFEKEFCGSKQIVTSNSTLSNRKQRTFYLKDLQGELRNGSVDPKQWTTYFHAYKNDIGGITIQYWRFYAFNGFPPIDFVPENFRKKISKLKTCCHGGDWECVQVILDTDLMPIKIRFTGHENITELDWANVIKKDDTHPLVYSVVEGHTSIAASGNERGIIQEVSNGGKVFYSDGSIKETGKLINVGEKCSPLNGQLFIQYTGLWGSPGVFYETSGYWGPAYNETDMNKITYFISAWGIDMKDKEKWCEGLRECYASNVSR